MFDYHMHSIVSYDGNDTPEMMAQMAVKAGLREICFTDHVDDGPLCTERFNRFTADEYAAAYDSLEVSGVKVRKGLEFGMLPDNQGLLKAYLQKRPFDFVIGSVHYVGRQDIYFSEYWEEKTQQQAELVCMDTTLKCVKAHDDFDVLGHLTYISKARSNPTNRLIPYAWYRELFDEILKTLASKGKGMEINSSGVDRCGDFLPAKEYLQRFKELGGQIITVGSDAHTADRVGQYMDRACQIAQDIFGYVCTFENRKPIFHKL